MILHRFSSFIVRSTAVAAVVLGSAGLVFADANKQGCGTRLRTLNTVPATRSVVCSQMGCLQTCEPITLTTGAQLCSCDGVSTQPSVYYDPVGSGATTKCVTTIVSTPGGLAISCQRGSCAEVCKFQTVSFPADPGPPSLPSRTESWCKCP